MFISATELRVKSIFKSPLFFRHAMRSIKQSYQAEGNIKTLTKVPWPKAYTLTIWKSKEDMLHYRNSGAHKDAMKVMSEVSSSFRSIHWESDTMPLWKDAMEKLQTVELIKLRK